MLPLIGIATTLIPELIRLISGDKTNTLATEVSHIVTDTVGTQDETQARAKLKDDPAIAAQLQTRLTEIALEAQKVQVQAEREQRQADLDKLKATLADTQSARSLTTTLADKGSPIAWGAPVMSIIIGIGFFVVLGMAMFGGELKDNNNIVYTLIGTMATAFATAISFWLGSSQGSRDKDETVRQMHLSHAAQTADLLAKVQQHPSAPAAVSKPQPVPEPVAAAPPVLASNVVPMQPAYPSNFTACLHEVLDMEGGFSNDSRDHGGLTNFGITHTILEHVRDVPRDSITAETMKALTLKEASSIYQSQYWNVLRCDDVPHGVDLMLFHFGVNAGPPTSAHVLQKVVGTTCDGVVGRQTTAAARRSDASKLIDDLAQAQITHYQGMKQFSTFGNGWINRVHCAQEVAKHMVMPPASVVSLAA